jgi:hypothetical protein
MPTVQRTSMASQKVKQKRTAKRNSARTGRPKTPSAPDVPPAHIRPKPRPTYHGGTALLGPGQPGEGKRPEQDQKWTYPTTDIEKDLYWDDHAGMIHLPVIPEEDEGFLKPDESDMDEDDEETEDEEAELGSDTEGLTSV